jgi:beta-galactosidase
MKDEYNGLLSQRQPGYLADGLGGRVEQYYALEKEFPVSGAWGNGIVSIWAEQLNSTAPDAQVLLRYGKSNGWLDDQPAAITRAYGKGRISYIGAILDDKLMAAAAKWMVQQSKVTPAFGTVPEGVEVSRRVGAGRRIFVFINFAQENRQVNLARPMKSLLANRTMESLTLPPYGVEVVQDQQ